MKQLPPGTMAISRPVQVHVPTSFSSKPAVQGPFLIQPAPAEIDGVTDGEATDLAYVSTGGSFTDDEEDDIVSVRERLGILLVAYQDGRVDVCLDVEKVEARWEGDRVSELQIHNSLLCLCDIVESEGITSLSFPLRNHRPECGKYTEICINGGWGSSAAYSR